MGLIVYMEDLILRKNEPCNSILDFALSYDLILANTWLRKRVSLGHL